MSFTNSGNGLNPRVNFAAEDLFHTITRQAAKDSTSQNRIGSAIPDGQSRSSNNSCCCWRSSPSRPASNAEATVSASESGAITEAGQTENTEGESASSSAENAVRGRPVGFPTQTNAARHVALKNILNTALQKLAPGDRLWPGTTRQIVLKMQRILDEDFQYMRQMYTRQRRMGGDYVGPIFLTPEQFEATATSVLQSRAQLDAEVKAYTKQCNGHAGKAQQMLGASTNPSNAFCTAGGRCALLFPNAIHPAFVRDCDGTMWELQAIRIWWNAVTGKGKPKYFDVRATPIHSTSSKSSVAGDSARLEEHGTENGTASTASSAWLDPTGLGGDWIADSQINLNHEDHCGVYDTDHGGVRLAIARLETGKLQFSTRLATPRPFFVHRSSHNDYAMLEARKHP
eukprot:INCI7684.1.p1 GENE.INCI7684.1~~INCI7684.1.p1  ORF type:complete len:400 (-),score=67.62 INCI7684.1:1965-3164(-)